MNQTVLTHHGIPGQKWGIRRFQRPDGSLTPKGQARLDKKDNKMASLMNDKVSGIQAPSGRVLKFVAKQGVFKSGKVAYKKENLIRGGD